MSTPHRPHDRTSIDARARSDAGARLAASTAATDRPAVETPSSRQGDAGPRPPLALERRIERTRLRARAAALERSLVASERRRQAIVDRYELLLEARDADRSSGPDPAASERRLERVRSSFEAVLSRIRIS